MTKLPVATPIPRPWGRFFFFSSHPEISRAVRQGDARVAVVIPPGLGANLSRGKTTTVQLVVDGSDPITVGSATTSAALLVSARSSELLAERIDAALREPAREAALQRRLQRHIDAGTREFKWFIYRFTSPAMRHLFANPKNLFQVEDAVVAMLAGDVFDNPRVRRRLLLFRALYAITTMAMLPRSLRSRWRRSRQARIGFSGETLQAEER